MRAGISSENSSSRRSGMALCLFPSPLWGGVRGGGRRYGALNLLKHAIDIRQHVVIPKAQNAIAVRFENLAALLVGRCPHRMLATVGLADDQPSRMAHEISHIPPN